jgi:(S)-ureidoglycine aminohydrolase
MLITPFFERLIIERIQYTPTFLTIPYLSLLEIKTDLPGFTRSMYRRNYALITPESHVFAGNPLW